MNLVAYIVIFFLFFFVSVHYLSISFDGGRVFFVSCCFILLQEQLKIFRCESWGNITEVAKIFLGNCRNMPDILLYKINVHIFFSDFLWVILSLIWLNKPCEPLVIHISSCEMQYGVKVWMIVSLKWLFVFLTIDLDLWCWIMSIGKHGLTFECNADDYFCSRQLKKGTNLLFQNLEENCM